MTTIPWYMSAILRQQIVQMIIAALTLFGIASEKFDVDATLASIFAGIGGLTAIWTFITRMIKPTPPITTVAVEATKERDLALKKQGGYTRTTFLFSIIAVGLLSLGTGTVLLTASGCTGSGTRAAYSQAENPAELAYVLAEHYATLLEQAAALRSKPGVPAAAITAMQRADTLAQPAVRALRPLSDAYLAAKTPASEAQLQAAVNRAVLAVADLVRSIQKAKT